MIKLIYPQTDIVLSCQLTDILILSDHTSVVAEIRSSEDDIVLKSTYYLYNGQVSVLDLRSIIEPYFAERPGTCINTFSIIVSPDGNISHAEAQWVDVSVLYFQHNADIVNLDDWLLNNFLISSDSKRIAPDGNIMLSWFDTSEVTNMKLLVNYSSDSGRAVESIDQLCFPDENNIGGITSATVSVQQIRNDIIALRQADNVVIHAITAFVGQRSATFYIDPQLSDALSFYFTNCFNIVEHIPIVGIVTRKTDCDRSVASLIDHSVFYDEKTSRSYQVETTGLTPNECSAIEQMLMSQNVRLAVGSAKTEVDFDAMLPVLITEQTCEISNADDKLNSVKFSWRFAENRPLQILKIPSERIFNDTYFPTFS